MIRDEGFGDSGLLAILKSDSIGRNRQLNTFIGLLNSINKNSILSIDGEWGSGKTIFAKQLLYINKEYNIDSNGILEKLEEVNVTNYKAKYEVYYYNAWENDHHEDPLQSLLANLIKEFWGIREVLADNVAKQSKAFANSLIKQLSLGLCNPGEVREIGNISDLVKNIKTVDETKRAIDDIINNHLELNGKKLLFVVDELDRCKPTFAVKLLETLKHYYTNDNIVFVISTNNQELSHTIRKVYGNGFDGPGYLNKFYDLIFDLPDVDINKYITYLSDKTDNMYLGGAIHTEIIDYLKLSMRQINRYYSSLALIENYIFSRDDGFNSGGLPSTLVKYVFIPLAYGLRVGSQLNYYKFVKGEGEEILKGFCEKNKEALSNIIRGNSVNVDDVALTVVQTYRDIFVLKDESNINERGIIASANTFKSVVLLINATGVIDEKVESEIVE